MHVLVLGGTRFIGRAAVTALVEAGHEVTLFHRGETGADFRPELRRVRGDRARLEAFAAEFAALRPDVVLDMHAMAEAQAIAAVKVFRGMASRLVAVSSCDVYRAYGRYIRSEPGPPDPVPLLESAPLREKLYPFRGEVAGADDYDKIPVERAVQGEPELPGTVLRLPAVYGPLDGGHRLFPCLKRMLDGRRAILLEPGNAGWRFCRGYVDDVGRAIALTVTDPTAAGRTYNVAEPYAFPEIDWVRRVGRIFGWQGEVVEVPEGEQPDHRTGSVDPSQDLAIDSSAIRRDLGYAEAIDSDLALARSIEWERTNPPPRFDPGRFDYDAEDAVLASLAR